MTIDLLAQDVVDLLKNNGSRVAFAESCTGGMAASAVVSVPGSSRVLDLSVVTYADSAKVEYTDVTEAVLDAHGAVSRETALLMASGIRKRSGADYGVGITGIAGPDGGTVGKPVGTVYVAVNNYCRGLNLTGDRKTIREETTRRTLEILHDCILQQTSEGTRKSP